jgi:hypothetical protein
VLTMTPKRQDFETELQRRFTAAVAAGRSSIRIVSGELHTGVGGHPGQNHRMPLCCQGMKNATREGDVVLQSPPSGQGATLIVQYRLPRT